MYNTRRIIYYVSSKSSFIWFKWRTCKIFVSNALWKVNWRCMAYRCCCLVCLLSVLINTYHIFWLIILFNSINYSLLSGYEYYYSGGIQKYDCFHYFYYFNFSVSFHMYVEIMKFDFRSFFSLILLFINEGKYSCWNTIQSNSVCRNFFRIVSIFTNYFCPELVKQILHRMYLNNF